MKHPEPIPPGSLRNMGYIYFILATENLVRPMLKIGFSLRSPHDRQRACQTGSPVPLQIIAYLHGRLLDERNLHKRFADQRSHGEWFYWEGALRQYVEELDV